MAIHDVVHIAEPFGMPVPAVVKPSDRAEHRVRLVVEDELGPRHGCSQHEQGEVEDPLEYRIVTGSEAVMKHGEVEVSAVARLEGIDIFLGVIRGHDPLF
jgi:hypothetical protein